MILYYFFALGLHHVLCRKVLYMSWKYRHLWLGRRQAWAMLTNRRSYAFHLCGYVVARLLYFSPAEVFRGDGERYDRLRRTAIEWQVPHLYDLGPITEENTQPWGSPGERRRQSLVTLL